MNVNEKMRICISSPPDRENLVAEFFLGDEQWGELNQEGSALTLEIYPKRSGGPWVLDFNEFLSTIDEGQRLLLGE